MMKKCAYKIKQCPYCQKYFEQNTNSQIYCSKECQKAVDQQRKQDSYKIFRVDVRKYYKVADNQLIGVKNERD